MKIAAIETTYNGVRFRSRLEARWAMYFDALGHRWEFEPEAFSLPDGQSYLPDFRLDGVTYAEVKPEGGDFSKARALAATGTVVMECEGPPPGLQVRRAAEKANAHRFWEPRETLQEFGDAVDREFTLREPALAREAALAVEAERVASRRVRVGIPGPAADALGLLAAFPDLADVAAEEGLPQLLPAGPLADLARDLIGGGLGTEEALGRLGTLADEPTARRLRALAGPGRPRPEEAARELRKAAIEASIEAIRAEQDRLLAQVARKGTPVPEDLQTMAQVAARCRSDLEKRLRSFEREARREARVMGLRDASARSRTEG